MTKKNLRGEYEEYLKVMPSEQLIAFSKIKNNGVLWQNLCDFIKDFNIIQKDRIYRLRRKGGLDGTIDQARDHEYYCGRVASLVMFLQVVETSGAELERRERKKR